MRVAMERRLLAGLVLAACLGGEAESAEDASADRTRIGRPPVYQRQRGGGPPSYSGRFGRDHKDRFDRRGRHAPTGHQFEYLPPQPAVAHGAWFQRPYPYHLDYYRLRYGGTYEPYYSGGLYGTPQVIAPPAFGYGYGPPYPPVPESPTPPVTPIEP